MCPQAQEQVGHSNKRFRNLSNPFQKWTVDLIKLLKWAKIETNRFLLQIQGPNNTGPLSFQVLDGYLIFLLTAGSGFLNF